MCPHLPFCRSHPYLAEDRAGINVKFQMTPHITPPNTTDSESEELREVIKYLSHLQHQARVRRIICGESRTIQQSAGVIPSKMSMSSSMSSTLDEGLTEINNSLRDKSLQGDSQQEPVQQTNFWLHSTFFVSRTRSYMLAATKQTSNASHPFAQKNKRNSLFLYSPLLTREKKNDLPKEGKMVAILTESLEEAQWLGQVEKAQGDLLTL